MKQFSRNENLIGKENTEKLKNSRVAVFGIGGVGGFTVEALVRSGVGTIDIIDSDKVDVTNLNRQIFATRSTVGEYKVEVAKKRILDINPDININMYPLFFDVKTIDELDFKNYDYIVDCIDTVSSKLLLIEQAEKYDVPIISCMGTGYKLEPTKLIIDDIFNTSVCPLARVMRYELRKRNIKKLKVVYSKEKPIKSINDDNENKVSASMIFVPATAGIILANEVIKDIIF